MEEKSIVGGKLSEQVFRIPKRIPGPWDIRMYEVIKGRTKERRREEKKKQRGKKERTKE